ncbi:MAG: hypothetical protein AAGG68_16970 [Bacteroidota bacterium]
MEATTETLVEKLYMKDMTQQKMYKTFGLQKVSALPELEEWLTNLSELTRFQTEAAEFYQQRLLDNIDSWNEQELSLGFIGPIINLINFKVPYKLNFFAQRSISATIGNYELLGRPDGIIASGNFEPEQPYFSFKEYKKDIDSSGDPIAQNLAAMLVGQHHNGDDRPVYGCYVVGRFWYFMVLKGKQYAISKDYSASQEDIYEIVQILDALRNILLKWIEEQ